MFQACLIEPFQGRMLKYVEFTIMSGLKVGFYCGSRITTTFILVFPEKGLSSSATTASLSYLTVPLTAFFV